MTVDEAVRLSRQARHFRRMLEDQGVCEWIQERLFEIELACDAVIYGEPT